MNDPATPDPKRSDPRSLSLVLRRPNVKRIAAGAVAALVTAEVLTRLVTPILPPSNGGLTRELDANVERLEARTEPIDTLIVGASQAGADIDPAALDQRSERVEGAHTIWMPGASVGTISTLAEDLALPRGTPERLIIGLTSRELNGSDVDRVQADQSVLTSAEFRRAAGTETVYDRLDAAAGNVFAVVRERDRLRSPFRIAQKLLGKDNSITEPLKANRFGMHTDRLDLTSFAETEAHLEQERRALADFALDEQGLAELESLVDGALAEDVEVVIVQLPVYERHYLELQPGLAEDDARSTQAIAEVAERTGATLLDPRQALEWDDPQWWADVNHLNGNGAARLTEWLALELDRAATSDR